VTLPPVIRPSSCRRHQASACTTPEPAAGHPTEHQGVWHPASRPPALPPAAAGPSATEQPWDIRLSTRSVATPHHPAGTAARPPPSRHHRSHPQDVRLTRGVRTPAPVPPRRAGRATRATHGTSGWHWGRPALQRQCRPAAAPPAPPPGADPRAGGLYHLIRSRPAAPGCAAVTTNMDRMDNFTKPNTHDSTWISIPVTEGYGALSTTGQSI